METAWDVWVSCCKWCYREGNERDGNAEDELDACVSEEFQKGEEGSPLHSMNPMNCELEEVLNLLMNGKKIWFNSMEAARGRVPMIHNEERDAEQDIRFTDCEPQRKSVRKWIAVGWR